MTVWLCIAAIVVVAAITVALDLRSSSKLKKQLASGEVNVASTQKNTRNDHISPETHRAHSRGQGNTSSGGMIM